MTVAGSDEVHWSHSTYITYACMHDHIWIFNNFIMVLKIIFSNRPIYMQKIGAPTLLVYEMHTCMHACMHAILF